jgi:hypothetical protein
MSLVIYKIDIPHSRNAVRPQGTVHTVHTRGAVKRSRAHLRKAFVRILLLLGFR